MAKSVEFMIVLRVVCLNLFPSLIYFDEDSNRGWKSSCAFIHSFCNGSIGLELFTWGYVGWRCAVKILTGNGTESSVCINCYWSENHLIVQKITDEKLEVLFCGYLIG